MKTANELIKAIDDLYLDEMTTTLGVTRQRLIDRQKQGRGEEPVMDTAKIQAQISEASAMRKKKFPVENAMLFGGHPV